MGPGSRPRWARGLPRPLRWGLRAGRVTRAPAEKEVQGRTGTGKSKFQFQQTLRRSPKAPAPMQPPPWALRPRLRLRSHFRHRRRPERKYLSRGARRQGCGEGAPPRPCVTLWQPPAWVWVTWDKHVCSQWLSPSWRLLQGKGRRHVKSRRLLKPSSSSPGIMNAGGAGRGCVREEVGWKRG